MWILQIADLHNSNKNTFEKMNKIIEEMSICINANVSSTEQLIFAICGDVLNKGDTSGFEDTLEFLQKMLDKIDNKNVEFVICPGNHDIVTNACGKSFKELDKFIFKLTLDSKIKFEDNSVNLKTINNIDFIIINSSYHLDTKYGKIDLVKLKKILDESKNEKKVIIIHHHLIPIKESENSTIVNSYEFFRLLEGKNILAILHGHQHMKIEIVVGTGLTRIIGVGSLLAEIDYNYNNQFNLININESNIENIIEHKYNMDEMGNGTLGKFMEYRRL